MTVKRQVIFFVVGVKSSFYIRDRKGEVSNRKKPPGNNYLFRVLLDKVCAKGICSKKTTLQLESLHPLQLLQYHSSLFRRVALCLPDYQ